MSLVNASNSQAHRDLSGADAEIVKQAIRRNEYSGHTAGLCPGLLQCNLVILPEAQADDFQSFCEANPIPCPLVARSNPGDVAIDRLGPEIDLRTELPLYRIYRNGVASGDCQDVKWLWRDDFVSFAIGCSFTFEKALENAGIEMRHVTQNVTVPMFKTSLPTVEVGPFGGPTVVSMRPIKSKDVAHVREICAAYPLAHGEPIHVGDPERIGITDIKNPDWGLPVTIRDDEVPVLWGCGVTSQIAISHAPPDLCITHAPGAMLITTINELANSEGKTAELPEEKLQ
ncbi:putative hydro-lyase [uncultured Ruegeria sp.]|uniref:putative hydro-lyase n=1 Tax=uncultured Ruegeria sp. TaxID=259304 RepID=UPI0026035F1C|nr:putative hydro-lyase [uncultured Ruegeria sp.]